MGVKPLNIWTITDGRAGIANQAIGLAEGIAALTPTTLTHHTVNLKSLWRNLPAWWPLNWWGKLDAASTLKPVDEPPNIIIGCGRQSLYFTKRWKQRWPDTFVIQLQDPKTKLAPFDMVIPPFHDELEGENVHPSVGALNRITPEKLQSAANEFPNISDLPGPTLAVLIGGNTKHQTITNETAKHISEQLVKLKFEGVKLLISTSRRTPRDAQNVFDAHLKPVADVYFTGDGPNPYFAMLNAADAVLVTADSINMASEAATAGKPVLVAGIDGKMPQKFERFHLALHMRGNARAFTGQFETWPVTALNETERLARLVADQYHNQNKIAQKDTP